MEDAAGRCGVLELAGVTVGAAFVGATASTVVVADILRLLHGGGVGTGRRQPPPLNGRPRACLLRTLDR
jgi:hypothetical protein